MNDRGLVVVLEDERAIAEMERLYLQQAGFGVHVAADGQAGLNDIRRLSPVAVIVDIGLPGLDGTEVVRRLRADGDWVPVVFVTAHDSEIDRVLGLELGADDYVTKPFSPRELVARVKALVRRSSGPAAGSVRRAGRIELDEGERRVRVGGAEVALTTTEFDLLAHLLSRPGQVFTREQLLSAVWGIADYSGTRTVDVHVAQLRAKLGDPDPIRTVRGVGYALEAAG
ncbi:response regulator transcription factor [Pseudolysinimonas kribbensis]|uniref:DNA-binding response regulator n=1 Tax=Pseudolysinimonas kribbensis TaxID=433641 RepID=A0ABQ6K544_9MICO|nr:response regulator transcription factor [Pseudolysinimonas kribbensis]GMA94846.1 DNA-binding response regulator [Pseudolysinimonas kribbensis]